MNNYKVPLRDIEFTAKEMFGYMDHYKTLARVEELPEDMLSVLLEEAAKFCEKELAPINRTGDEQGCTWVDGDVTTPQGFKDAFKSFAEGGWVSLAESPEHGGQGLPFSLFMVVFEMLAASNMSWSLYIANYYGCLVTLGKFGTKEQQERYMPKLVSAEWNCTMCLTEAHCGSDLGLLRTKATPNGDGSYAINGSKIFITSGEHDLNDNIIHLVLARLPDAPEGTKGISLFIVPKFNINDDGSLGERNAAHCTGIEEKMGIHGSATCSMQFDDAKGFLLGEENKGLMAMFTYMNESRVTTAIQAYAAGEASFQGALSYAKDRIQMRAPKRTRPDLAADPIISHPDVRRMLLSQKSFVEGGRMLSYYCLKQMDLTLNSDDPDTVKKAEKLLAFLTPIAKGFNSETGIEVCAMGVQTYGGHGFISEYGMEQLTRDQRITAIYEGVTAIQGLDLLGRKTMSMGLLEVFMSEVQDFIDAEQSEAAKEFIAPLKNAVEEWKNVSGSIAQRAQSDVDLVGSCAYDFLMYSGYITLAYFWAQAAITSLNALDAGSDDKFYQTKIDTARFYFARILPRSQTHASLMKNDSSDLMAIDAEHFSF
jgi:alkylation response protein AidB-like acyl-CoA dehydrogenase